MNKELEKGVKMTPQEEKKESIRQEDSKALKKYLVVLVLCGVIGGFTGFFGAKASDSHMLAEIVKTIADGFYMVVPYVPFVGTTIAIIVSVILYRKSRKTFEQWDGEDEEVMEGIERNLSIVLFIHAAVMVIFYAFIALGFSYFSRIHEIEDIPWAAVILFIIGFIETTVYILIAEQKVVNMEKEMNPEKQGSIFDGKFQKKWIDSCDEAEQIQIYKASYASYKATSMACIGMWVFSLIGMTLWGFGVWPNLMVCAVWLVQISSYCIATMKKQNLK